MKQLNLAPRMEPHEKYEKNRHINELIRKAFRSSVEHFIPNTITTNAFKTQIITIETPFFVNTTTAIPAGDLEYATTTLRHSGCAVFCFHQGLTKQGIYADVEELTDEIAKKGYYEPGKGTYHNLFDHWGIERASHYREIIEALKHGGISTCLVRNAVYHCDPNRSGKHFVNVVGIRRGIVCVDDPNCGRFEMEFEHLLDSTEIAWIW